MHCADGMGRLAGRADGGGVGVGVCAGAKPATKHNKAKARKHYASARPDRLRVCIAISTTIVFELGAVLCLMALVTLKL